MQFFKPNIEKLKAEKNIGGLIKALKFNDKQIVHHAALALGELNATQAVDALIEALFDVDGNIALAPAWALVRLYAASIPLLINTFRLKHFQLNTQAAGQIMQYLAPNQPATGLQRLSPPTFLSDKIIPEPLRKVLNRLPSQYDPKIHLTTLLFILIGPYGVPQLLNALKQQDPEITDGVTATLRYMGWQPQTDQEKLLYWMETRQYQKCVSLGDLAKGPLLDLIKDKHSYTDDMVGAVEAIGMLRLPEAVDSLIGMLGSKYFFRIREAAFKALVNIGPPAVEPLIRAIKEEDAYLGSFNLRLKCLDVLVQMKYVGLLPLLISQIEDEDEEYVVSVAEMMQNHGWVPSLDRLGALYWAALRKWDKCIEIGPVGIDGLLKTLNHKHIHVRKPAAEALVSFYKSGNLSDEDKKKILSVKKIISQKHTDETTHYQSDCSPHTDTGIGIKGLGWQLW